MHNAPSFEATQDSPMIYLYVITHTYIYIYIMLGSNFFNLNQHNVGYVNAFEPL